MTAGVGARQRGYVISVFDERVWHDGRWVLQEKRLSGFRKALQPTEAGARLTVEFEGQAICLLRGSPWRAWQVGDGQAYGVGGGAMVARPAPGLAGVQLEVRVDGVVARTIELETAPVEIPLAEGLGGGRHRLEICCSAACRLTVLGFRVVSGPWGAIGGSISAEAEEYLNDVRVRIWQGSDLVDEALVRNAVTGEVLIWGLARGVYDLQFEAVGWQGRWVRGVEVAAGRVTRFGQVRLASEPLARPCGAVVEPNRGHPVFVESGRGFDVLCRGVASSRPRGAVLRRWLKSYQVDVESAAFDAAGGLWRLGVVVPRTIPQGLYHLELQVGGGVEQAVQAVCVRAGRKRRFRIVKFGHMDTWTQRNAEYLVRLVELVNLIDPDVALISNEVNWHYVAGALSRLEVPYFVTSGNHGLPGLERYFGAELGWARIGAVFVANYGRPWDGRSGELEELFEHASGARFRVLQGVEPDLPLELGRRLGVDLYVFGHGFTGEWLGEQVEAKAAPWTALGKEFHVVDVDPSSKRIEVAGVAERIAGMRAKYPISRYEPWPAVRYEPANDGQHRTVRVVIRNPLTIPLRRGRLRLVMPVGRYRSSAGRIDRIIDSDDGRFSEVQVVVPVAAKGRLEVTVGPE